jgi:NADH-quinone oxidoreductase subunit H
MDYAEIIERSLLILTIFGITLGVATYLTYIERKVAAFLQDRLGPDRAGPWGLLQPIADAGKMFFKEDFTPAASERFLFIIGPGIAMFTACMTGAVVPWGPVVQLFGREVDLQIANVDIGILYVMGMVSVGVYGIMIGGWASNNKYSLYGAIRASSQMISYELAMGLSLIAVIMLSGSLNLRDIVAGQSGDLFGISAMPAGMDWNIFYQPVGFLIFFTCALAECNRAPFDLPECETELVGGYHTEYSSMKLGFYLFAEYINMFISSAIVATVYFGGYTFPGMWKIADPTVMGLIGAAVLFAKIAFFIFVFMWIRWTLPRFRYDQLMHLGWKVLIPLAVLNMLLTGGFSLLFP